eukprot:COSAG06_NODE_63632_length_261_cov_10.358025_1_plen_34_part_10
MTSVLFRVPGPGRLRRSAGVATSSAYAHETSYKE